MRVSGSTASTAKTVFHNLHFTCPHCGKVLETKTLGFFGGNPYTVPLYTSCGCEESKWDGTDVVPSERRYVMAGIPERYLHVDCDLMGYEQVVWSGRSLYVHGPNGTAKSSFAGQLGRRLVDMGQSVFWVNAKHLVSEIQGTFGGRQTDVLDRAYACHVLVLDDLGKEQPTAFALSMLYELVELRYGAMKPFVVTSNFDRAQLASRWAASDVETGEAIVSRLCDGVEVLELGGEDRRLA